MIRNIIIFILLFSSLCRAESSSQPKKSVCEAAISNLSELGEAVTKNARFSDSSSHEHLFETYAAEFLGKESLSKGLKDVMNVLREHPELYKPQIREQRLTVEQRIYETPQSLIDVIQRLKKSADEFQANLSQPEANIGFWQRILFPLKKEELSGFRGREKKMKKQEHTAQFKEYFKKVLTEEDRGILRNTYMSSRKKTIAVYQILNRIRSQMISEKRDTQALSQMMVDLVHTSGFRSPNYREMLGDKKALNQISGLEKILNERDAVAIELNFEGHFSELQNSLNIDHPTGLSKKENLSQIISDIQREIQSSPYTVEERQVLRVRALSLQESPFRGCLGLDCSSGAYFDLALDPNFVYFTLTDTKFRSSGHITVVLGAAYSQKEEKHIKTAFVDKIQNVSQALIFPMLESIRLSLEELDYRLALPVDVGDHNGLSNGDTTRAYLDSEVNPFLTHQLKGFMPHKNSYDFIGGYSRAYSKPDLLEFEKHEGDFKIQAGEIYSELKIPEDLKVKDLFQEVLSLRDSNSEEDQIKFMDHLKSLALLEGLELSKDFPNDYLKSKIIDKSISFEVRKKALYTFINLNILEEGYRLWHDRMLQHEIREVLNFITQKFSESEQIEFIGEISNWIHSRKREKQKFMSILVHEIMKIYIENNTQFSFHSIIIDALNSNISLLEDVIEDAIRLGAENTKVIKYLSKDLTLSQIQKLRFSILKGAAYILFDKKRVQSLRGKKLEELFYFLTEKQKSWVSAEQLKSVSIQSMEPYPKSTFAPYLAPLLNQTEIESLTSQDLHMFIPFFTETQKNQINLEVFKEMTASVQTHTIKNLLPHLNQRLFEQLEGENMPFFSLTEKQKNWVTFEQFQEIPGYYSTEKIAPYIALKLTTTEIQNLSTDNLRVSIPYLTNEQKRNITFQQFQEIPWHFMKEREEIAPYVAPKLTPAEIQSLSTQDLRLFIPYLSQGLFE